ncbi:hypothetical protein V8E36_002576 [Tilletia maclaganii]
MPLRPVRRPAHIPPLSALLAREPADSSSSAGGSSSASTTAGPRLVRPAEVVLLLDEEEENAILLTNRGDARPIIGETGGSQVTRLGGLVLMASSSTSSSSSVNAGVPSALVHRLSDLPPSLPSDSQARHFTLPVLTPDTPITSDSAWLDALSLASQRGYTLQFSLQRYGLDSGPRIGEQRSSIAPLYEHIEELFSKSFSQDLEARERGQNNPAQAEGTSSAQRVRFILDAFGAPPTHLTASQLLRSREHIEWTEFCSRLALHPDVYVELSPPTSASASHGHNLSRLSKNERAELRRKVQIWISVVLDAFGDERLVFAATGLDPGHTSKSAPESLEQSEAKAAEGVEAGDRSGEISAWFELVREVLVEAGVDTTALTNIFQSTAAKLYGLQP